MRKTPLSAPGGSYQRRNYDWMSRDRRHGYNGSGYGSVQGEQKNECIVPNQGQASPLKNEVGFIPLGYSSPINQQQRHSGNWRGPGSGHRHRSSPISGGYNAHRNSFPYDTPKSSFSDSGSPKYFHKQNFGQRKPHQKDSHRNVDISNYINVKAMLEDPWADLMQKLEKSQTSVSSKESADLSQSSQESVRNDTSGFNASGSSCGSILIGDLNVKSDSMEEQTIKS